jgi:radical SAM protein (TIGR01212 family)
MQESRISDPESPNRYNAYGRFLRKKFGCRVYKISVDAGFGCPNRDGTISTGGCTFCSASSFVPRSANRFQSVSQQIQAGADYLRRRYNAEKFIVYLQPYTNTYGPLEKLIPVYQSAVDHPDVVGLSIGTRPDCVDEEKIAWLEKLAGTYFVTLEYGLQSVYDSTLLRIQRGHNFQCWLDAMGRSRNRGIWLCAHLILGFPWETREEILRTADVLSDKGLDFLKLHHLHIVRNTIMENEYRENPFHLLELEEYADLVVDFLERLNPDICIERLFGSAPKEELIGPIWNKSKGGIRSYIEQRLAARNTYQGKKAVGSRQ